MEVAAGRYNLEILPLPAIPYQEGCFAGVPVAAAVVAAAEQIDNEILEANSAPLELAARKLVASALEIAAVAAAAVGNASLALRQE